MKKIAIFIFIICCSFSKSFAQAQAGDLYFGAQGSYITNYKDFTAGVRGAYHFSPLFELNLSFSTNPWLSFNEDNDSEFDAQLYYFDLNGQFYVINNKTWGMAPVIGACYYISREERVKGSGTFNGQDASSLGLNLGWDIRYYINNYLRINGFWKYSILKNDNTHHVFGVGIGYYFNVF